jgi:DNA-binding beta-propeller fold protein YncE
VALRVENGVRAYEAVEGWGELKPGWIWGQVGDVAVDSNDRVHVFTRNANPPYRIYDTSGKLLHSWGHGLFEDAHGICIGPDDMVYLTDRGPQLVMKFTNDGRHLFTIGDRYKHSDTGYTDESPTVKQAAGPFHHPTNVGLRPNGEFFVSDGYRNARVHKFATDGTLITSWGEPGEGPGQFNLVHHVIEHKDKVYVCDRANNRIQIFTPEGKWLETWPGFERPCKIYIDNEDTLYVAELGARVSILDAQGNVLWRWGGEPSDEPGHLRAPHGIYLDSQGGMYVSEVLQAARLQKFARVK